MIPSAASTQSTMTVPLTEDKRDIEKPLERHFSLEPLNDREQQRRIGRSSGTLIPSAPGPVCRRIATCRGTFDLRKEPNGGLRRTLTTKRLRQFQCRHRMP